MSWYTVGEIFVWMLIAAVLGGALGWVLRGILQPVVRTGAAGRAPEVDRVEAIELAAAAEPDLVEPAEPDDLARIHGIGPTFARRLNELGITTFARVARLDDDELAVLADDLGVPRARILRDDWTGHARQLHDEVHG